MLKFKNESGKLTYCCSFDRKLQYPNCKAKKIKSPSCNRPKKTFESTEPLKKYIFCNKCNSLHQNKNGFSTSALKKPMKNQVLPAMTEDTTQAQYLLADRSIEFLKRFIDKMNYELIVCLGMPRLFEEINKTKTAEVFLFDIDDRFRAFHKNFCQYNMFNNHFFNSTEKLKFTTSISNLAKPNVL